MKRFISSTFLFIATVQLAFGLPFGFWGSNYGGLVATPIGKGSLAWFFDFDDATDSHTGGLDLTPVNTPTYSGGAGTSYKTGNHLWDASAAGGALPGTNTTQTLVVCLRLLTGIASGDYVLSFHNQRWQIRYLSGNWQTKACNVTNTTGVTATVNAWTVLVITWDSAGGQNTTYINNGSAVNASGTFNESTGNDYIGGSTSAAGRDCEFRYAYFLTTSTTPGERAWSTTTITYADIP